jgi:hypothetical protein
MSEANRSASCSREPGARRVTLSLLVLVVLLSAKRPTYAVTVSFQVRIGHLFGCTSVHTVSHAHEQDHRYV